MSDRKEFDVNKKELIEVLNGLPPTKVAQLLEFARHLQSPADPDHASVRRTIQRTRGKYREVLSSREEFAARSSDKCQPENRD